MREIIFRGKRVDNGEWVEGIPIKTYDTEIGMNLPLRYKPKNITLMNNDRVLLCCAMDDSAYFDTEDHPIIDDETIGQYTGLKDLHGTRIFEGDVVRLQNLKRLYEVYWNKKEARYKARNGGCVSPLCNGYNVFVEEVVGNVFDNPELLKGSAKNE